jgi:hypothetical protein
MPGPTSLVLSRTYLPLVRLSLGIVQALSGFTSDASSPPSLTFDLEYVAKLMPYFRKISLQAAGMASF